MLGIEVELKKRVQRFDKIFEAFNLMDKIWTVQQLKNLKNVIEEDNTKGYKIDEKLTKMDCTKCTSEQKQILKTVSIDFRDQNKLIYVLKQIIMRPFLCSDFIKYIKLRDALFNK